MNKPKFKIVKKETPKLKIIKKETSKLKIISKTKKGIFFNINEKTSKDILPIHESYSPISSLQDIPKIIEKPLISTIEKLFLKNITTISSSANWTNINIMIFYDKLSPYNKEIAKKLGGTISSSWWSGFRPIVSFSLPAKITPTKDIIQRWEWLADQFEEQKIIIKPSYTLKEFADMIMRKPGATQKEILNSMQMAVYTYDEKNQKIRLK